MIWGRKFNAFVLRGEYDKNHNLEQKKSSSVQLVYNPKLAIFQITDQLNASYWRYNKFYTCVLIDFSQQLHEIMKKKKQDGFP